MGGGESYVLADGVVTKGNGDAFLTKDSHMSLSTGGGQAGQGYPCALVSEPILLESNQNHATIQTDGVCTALPASMGMGGGYVPMVVGADMYNQTLTGDVAKSLNNKATDSDHIPCVAFEPGAVSRVGGHVYEESTGSLRANAGDNQQTVCYSQDSYDKLSESENSASLKASGGNYGGGSEVIVIQ